MASGGPPIAVLMATQDIPLGATVTEDMLGIRNLPTSYVDTRHIPAEDAQRVVGVRASMGVRAGEAILWTDLSTNASERSLSGLIRTGMRGVTFRADVTNAFGGLLRPGDRVDVNLTARRVQGDRNSPEVTIPLLQNVLVLAVGADIGGVDLAELQRDIEGGITRRSYSEVTFSVTMEQAALLTQANNMGRLTLFLRNSEDVAVTDRLPETSNDDILIPERRERVQRRQPRPETPMPVRLENINRPGAR
jgi:pilus assembly protein CpaB